ncbi:hypothetical protein D3C80_1417680 [compost metagenome]
MKDYSEPAFPVSSEMCGHHVGMSLRDYFAANVMQGICAHQDTWGLGSTDIPERAYFIADLMLEAREK